MKALLFDLDGTLLNREATLISFCKAQYEKFSLEMNLEKYVKKVCELDANGYVRKKTVYAEIAKEFNLSKEIEQNLFLDYMNHFQEYCVPFNGLTEMLKALKEKQFLLGIITNGRHEGQMASLRALSIEDFFDVVLISESEGLAKPDSELFERALSRLGVKANVACYVGDHPINDMEAARKVGLKTIWKKNEVYKAGYSDAEINNLSEILPVIEGMSSV